VHNFGEKKGLDSRKPSTGAACNKLPVARAAVRAHEIKDLRQHPAIPQKKLKR
jgi:hypothetical protein